MPQKDDAVIDVGYMGFLHIQRQLQLAFQKGTAFLADGLGMGLRPFDNDDEVIGITTIGYGRFPLAVLSNRDRTTLLNAEVPLRKNCLTGVNSTLLLPLSPPPPRDPRLRSRSSRQHQPFVARSGQI